MATMDYENENGRYDDEARYDRERSASPRAAKRDDTYRGGRDRSASPNGRMNSRGPPASDSRAQEEREAGARNTGSNLFVTGLPQTLSEQEVSRMFEKYGEVENCSIMKDPHTQESRGFGFVKMVTAEQADAAKEGLQGENIGGRTLSIEKARRARPRTPTPGRYFGPPKREDDRDRRSDDRRPYGGYRDDYRDRRGGYERRDDFGSRRGDRYGGGRTDRYERRDDRRDERRDERRGDDRRDDRRDERRDRDRAGDREGYYRETGGRWEGASGDDRYSRR